MKRKEEKEIEEESTKEGRTPATGMEKGEGGGVRASSAGLEDAAAGTSPIALLAGIKKHSRGDCL